MKKGTLITIAILVGIVLVFIFMIMPIINNNQANKIAAECLRGDSYACTYFNAQEEVNRIEDELTKAKVTLTEAKNAYENSKNQNGGQ